MQLRSVLTADGWTLSAFPSDRRGRYRWSAEAISPDGRSFCATHLATIDKALAVARQMKVQNS